MPRYDRPGPDSGNLLNVPKYQAPEEPSVPDVLETTESAETRPRPPLEPEYLPEPAPVNPVPVHVVNYTRDLVQLTRATFYNYAVEPQKVMTIPGRRNRLRMTLRSTTADAVLYLSHSAGAGVNGFPLVTGQPDVELQNQGTVYVYNDHDTDTFIVGVVEEYVTELK